MDKRDRELGQRILDLASTLAFNTFDVFGFDSLAIAQNVFAHTHDIHSFLKACSIVAHENTNVFIQTSQAEMIVNNEFDTIYHEHLCYYNLRNVISLLAPYGLEVFDAYHTPIHSGSIIAKVCHSDSELNQKTNRYHATLQDDAKYNIDSYREFFAEVENYKGRLYDLLKSLKDEGKTIYAYGAPAKGNTLLNYCGLTSEIIDKAYEINKLKIMLKIYFFILILYTK